MRSVPIFSRSLTGIASPAVLLGVALPLFVTFYVGALTQWTDTLALGRWGTEAQVGVYSIAARAAMLGALPVISLNVILAPFVAEAFGQGDLVRLASVYRTGNRWAHLAGLPVMAILFIFTPGYLAWIGHEYVVGATAFRILLVGFLATVLTEPAGYMLSMTGRQKAIMVISLAVFVANVAMILLFVPRWGMVGAASASAVSIAVKSILQLGAAYHWSRLLPWGTEHLRPVAATGIAVAVVLVAVYLLPFVGTGAALAGTTVGFGLVYVLAMHILGLCPEDRVVWEAVRRKLGA